MGSAAPTYNIEASFLAPTKSASTEQVVLAVDIGTSSLKAAYITAKGELLASTRIRFSSTKRTAFDWLDAFCRAWLDLHKTFTKAEVLAIAISGNGPTLVSIAEDYSPTALYLWNEALADSKLGIEPSSSVDTKGPSLFIPRIRSFYSLYPEQTKNAHLILSGPEFLIFALCGNAVTILPDNRYTPAYWTTESLAQAKLDPSKLAPFMLQGNIAGYTRDCPASYTSKIPALNYLPNGIPVITGGPDFTVALIGTGTIKAGKACDRAGTSEGLNLCIADHIVKPNLRTLPAIVPELWNISALLPDSGRLFHTWRKTHGLQNLSYPELMTQIEEVSIFEKSLDQASTKNKDKAKESILLGRALVEEIGFAVKKGMDLLEEASGFSASYVLSGGQARNTIWCQMKSDITGRELSLTNTPDAELTGDAALAFVALGTYVSLEEAVDAMVKITKVYTPDLKKHKIYMEKMS